MLCFCGYSLGRFRIPDDKIRIRTGQDRAFLRINIKDLGDIGRGHRHKFIGCEPPHAYALRPKNGHTLLKTAGSIRNFYEITNAKAFLLGSESTMISCHNLKRTRGQPSPQTVLIYLVAKWWRHHAACSI